MDMLPPYFAGEEPAVLLETARILFVLAVMAISASTGQWSLVEHAVRSDLRR
jgi:hypothetical protein